MVEIMSQGRGQDGDWEDFQYAIDISAPRLTLAFAQTTEKIN